MKNFMFTAIAMVALMGSSMANTIDAPVSEKNWIIEKEDSTLKIDPKNDCCVLVAGDVVNEIDPCGDMEYTAMVSLFNTAFSICYNS